VDLPSQWVHKGERFWLFLACKGAIYPKPNVSERTPSGNILDFFLNKFWKRKSSTMGILRSLSNLRGFRKDLSLHPLHVVVCRSPGGQKGVNYTISFIIGTEERKTFAEVFFEFGD
jgi:hypothetical protein